MSFNSVILEIIILTNFKQNKFNALLIFFVCMFSDE